MRIFFLCKDMIILQGLICIWVVRKIVLVIGNLIVPIVFVFVFVAVIIFV